MNILSLLLPLIALASPPPGTINLEGSCLIERAAGNETVPLHLTFGSKLFVLGYVGDDGGDYEINIVNNGGSRFEAESGAVAIGFARANAVIQNPPLLCPTSPEEARLACQEQNRINNPPFVPAPSDHFSARRNENGDVKYEILGRANPDNFQITKVQIPASKIVDFNTVTIETPPARLGGVKASCSLSATRN
jgi:hypothetical protein